MKLTEEQRLELFHSLRGPNQLPPVGPETLAITREVDGIATQDVDRIQPIIEKWFDKYEAALAVAESFITGFEGDEMQIGVDDMLTQIRTLLPMPAKNVGWVAPHRYTVRVRYKIMGGHTHFQIRTGKTGFTLGVAVEDGCMTNEEFEAFMHGNAFMEFVDGD